ncbi:MAG: MotA/TolQ/ExbB proton channel family protein, partial [Phycisphaerales bacterium]|nr:MotA/TolQ/ExbB proton channel family protein [Phycisphaerales bacterium]
LRRLNRALHDGDRAQTKTLTQIDRSPYGELGNRLLVSGNDEAQAIADAEDVRPRFDKGLVILSTIITAAPMLGILGTVIGIIQSFELLGGDATISDPRQVSGGIAEALITTACGLVVALMALFPYMIFRGQQERSLGRMESLISSALQGFQTPSQATQQTSNRKTAAPTAP